ncbi:MAG: outer membrane beta-barrel protein [Myxococcales bacterium]|nr:outer membrane beta-barrel protein [Myxococcales bacterium]
MLLPRGGPRLCTPLCSRPLSWGSRRPSPRRTSSSPRRSRTRPRAGRRAKARYDYRAFIDAFGSVNYNRPRRHGGANIAHGNDWSTGFGLVWAGLDVSGDYGPVGGTLGVRLGPVTELYNGADTSYGLQYLKQAYATLRPIPRSDRLAIDFGKMDTLYGAEVADSQDNLNYTRGALVWIEQPFFHTGLRIRYQALRWLEVAALAVNGWNNTLDNNRGKTFGIQETITALDGDLTVALGYLTGPEGDDVVSVACPMDTIYDGAVGCAPAQGSAASATDVAFEGVNRNWRHFADLVIRYRPHRRLLLLVNADFTHDRLPVDPSSGATTPGMMYGVMAAAGFSFTERWSAAARGEMVDDVYNTWTRALSSDAGIDRLRLITGTVTLRYQPVPQLAVMLDNRVDSANHPIFDRRGATDAANVQVTSTLGVIVMTR